MVQDSRVSTPRGIAAFSKRSKSPSSPTQTHVVGRRLQNRPVLLMSSPAESP